MTLILKKRHTSNFLGAKSGESTPSLYLFSAAKSQCFLVNKQTLNHNLNIFVGNWSLLHPFRLSGDNAFLFLSLQTHFFNNV